MLFGGPDNPQNCPFSLGSWTPSSTWFLGPTLVYPPIGILISPTIFAWFTNVTNRQTTLLHLTIAAMQHKNVVTLQLLTKISVVLTKLYIPGECTPYGLQGSNALLFMCWFWRYINCLFVCLLNFLPPFLPSWLFSLCLFFTCLLPYLSIYSFQNRPIPLPGRRS